MDFTVPAHPKASLKVIYRTFVTNNYPATPAGGRFNQLIKSGIVHPTGVLIVPFLGAVRLGLRNQVRNQANFGSVKGQKNQEKQRNQNFTKESEKIFSRKLGYRKDSYSKTGVQKR